MTARPSLLILGDSTSKLDYLAAGQRWPQLLKESMASRGIPIDVTVHAVNGGEVADFLTGGAYPPTTWATKAHSHVLVRFGWNQDNASTYATDLDLLITEIQSQYPSATIMLANNWATGYPDWHTSPRTVNVDDCNAVTAAAATANGFPLLDLHTEFANIDLTGRYILSRDGVDDALDFRVRLNGWTGSNPEAISPNASGDKDGLGGDTWDLDWVSDIHPNYDEGCVWIAKFTEDFLVDVIRGLQ